MTSTASAVSACVFAHRAIWFRLLPMRATYRPGPTGRSSSSISSNAREVRAEDLPAASRRSAVPRKGSRRRPCGNSSTRRRKQVLDGATEVPGELPDVLDGDGAIPPARDVADVRQPQPARDVTFSAITPAAAAAVGDRQRGGRGARWRRRRGTKDPWLARMLPPGVEPERDLPTRPSPPPRAPAPPSPIMCACRCRLSTTGGTPSKPGAVHARRRARRRLRWSRSFGQPAKVYGIPDFDAALRQALLDAGQ